MTGVGGFPPVRFQATMNGSGHRHRVSARPVAALMGGYQAAQQETLVSETPHQDEETTHRRYERRIGTATLIATLVAAVCAGGAYYQARRQADIAQAALIESDHPFLELSAKRNADISRDGKTYLSVTATITNQGSKPAALQYAQFAIVNASTPAETALQDFKSDCAVQLIRMVVPVNGSVRTECRSKIPKPDRELDPQHLVGVIVYGGQLGARWRQSVDMGELTGGEWFDVHPSYDLETRIDGAGNPIPSEKYH